MSAGYLDGFRIHYRRRRTDRYESFETVTLRRPSADAFAIRRLVEGVEYEVGMEGSSVARFIFIHIKLLKWESIHFKTNILPSLSNSYFTRSSSGFRSAFLPLGRGAAFGAASGEDAPGVGPGLAAPDPGSPNAQLDRCLRRVDHAWDSGSNRTFDRIPGRALGFKHLFFCSSVPEGGVNFRHFRGNVLT